MLPSLVAEDLRASLTSFLGTMFALGDDDVRAELERFVGDPEFGVFRGPFVRLRLPFRPADDEWRAALDWSPAGCPHRGPVHQGPPALELRTRPLIRARRSTISLRPEQDAPHGVDVKDLRPLTRSTLRADP